MRYGKLLEDYFYTDQDVFDAERTKIFLKGSFIPMFDKNFERARYSTLEFSGIPMLTAGADTGTRRVFLNICPHKRMTVLLDEFSDSNLLRCPYHGWQFNDIGKCVRQ